VDCAAVVTQLRVHRLQRRRNPARQNTLRVGTASAGVRESLCSRISQSSSAPSPRRSPRVCPSPTPSRSATWDICPARVWISRLPSPQGAPRSPPTQTSGTARSLRWPRRDESQPLKPGPIAP
jgi:hypothetical protein